MSLTPPRRDSYPASFTPLHLSSTSPSLLPSNPRNMSLSTSPPPLNLPSSSTALTTRRLSRKGLTTPILPQSTSLPERILEKIFFSLAAEISITSEQLNDPSAIAKGVTGGANRSGQCQYDVGVRMEVAAKRERLKREMSRRQSELLTLVTLSKTTQPIAERALYARPHLPNITTLQHFASSLSLGESRWDSLKLNPYSTPGRYVLSLDLRHVLRFIPSGTGTGTETERSRSHVRLIFYNCLGVIIPLVPMLQELYLPEGCGTLPRTILEQLGDPDGCASRLKILSGVEVTHRLNSKGMDPLVEMLGTMRGLEELSITGLGGQDEGIEAETVGEEKNKPRLRLPRLRVLQMSAVKNGLLLHSLIRSQLPSLRELHMNSYYPLINDLTHIFLLAHGYKLHTLCIHPSLDWPPLRIPPHIDILPICPRLQVLRCLDRGCIPLPEMFEEDGGRERRGMGEVDLANDLGMTISGMHIDFDARRGDSEGFEGLRISASHHDLKELTITKWSTSPNSRAVPSGGHVDRLLEALHNAVAPGIRATSSNLSTSPNRFTQIPFSTSPPTLSTFGRRSSTPFLPSLQIIHIEEFTWTRADLGPAALDAGVNGLLRRFAQRMVLAKSPGRPSGVKVLDMNGNEFPVLPSLMGKRGSIGAGKGRGMGLSLGGGARRSFDQDNEIE